MKKLRNFLFPASRAALAFMAGMFLTLQTGPALAALIQPDNMIAWVPGVTVGVRGGIPTVSTVFTNLYHTNTLAEIQHAVSICPSNQVVMLPDTNGVYDISGGLNINTPGAVLRGAGPNTVLFGNIGMGSDPNHVGTYPSPTGGLKGANSLTLSYITNQFGEPLVVGGPIEVTADFSSESDTNWPVIASMGFKHIIRQFVIIDSVAGNTITFSPPLVMNFTNGCTVLGMNEGGFWLPNGKMGIENLTITSTNAGRVCTSRDVISIRNAKDSWVKGVNVRWCNQYGIEAINSAFLQIDTVAISGALGFGNSHAGLITADASGCLFQNNIIDGQQVGHMFNDGFCGNAEFGDFFTNNTIVCDVDCHNAHPVMNLWEGCVFSTGVMMDGYYGSVSHQTLLRNWNNGTMRLKRWATQMQIVGNVVGGSGTSLYFATYPFTQWPAFEIGYPNIGNESYSDFSPPVSGNWPGFSSYGYGGLEPTLTNLQWAFTNTQVLTTNLVGLFTNIPAPNAWFYPIRFQDNQNTNLYWPQDGTVVYETASGTKTNLAVTPAITVTNGWKTYLCGPIWYQHAYTNQWQTENITGNAVMTNASGVVVWDKNGVQPIPSSLLYPSGPPTWWGTNRWPAIDPQATTMITPIPAQLRYLGIPSGTNLAVRPAAPTGLHTTQ